MAGTYCIIDPIPALKAAMGGKPVPAPLDTVPYKWDAPDRNVFVVESREARPAYQRADPKSKVLYHISDKDTFEAIASVPGNDKEEWWFLANGARAPRHGLDIVTVKVG